VPVICFTWGILEEIRYWLPHTAAARATLDEIIPRKISYEKKAEMPAASIDASMERRKKSVQAPVDDEAEQRQRKEQ